MLYCHNKCASFIYLMKNIIQSAGDSNNYLKNVIVTPYSYD